MLNAFGCYRCEFCAQRVNTYYKGFFLFYTIFKLVNFMIGLRFCVYNIPFYELACAKLHNIAF